MNYKRIYNQFIADRRAKEHTLTGYTEKHHIVPRSLGGDNSKENLIRLTAEDHLHAHLLLAKIYGGSQWGGVWALIKLKGNDRCISNIFKNKKYIEISRKESALSKRKDSDSCIISTAKKFSFYSDWHNEEPNHTQIARKRGIFEECVQHMKKKPRPIKWGISSCINESKKFSNKTEWFKKSQSSYNAAKKFKIFDKCVLHMQTPISTKKIVCFNTGEIFDSTYAVANKLKRTHSAICYAIRNKTNCGGYKWGYA